MCMSTDRDECRSTCYSNAGRTHHRVQHWVNWVNERNSRTEPVTINVGEGDRPSTMSRPERLFIGGIAFAYLCIAVASVVKNAMWYGWRPTQGTALSGVLNVWEYFDRITETAMNYEDPGLILAFAFGLGMICLVGVMVVEYIVERFDRE